MYKAIYLIMLISIFGCTNAKKEFALEKQDDFVEEDTNDSEFQEMMLLDDEYSKLATTKEKAVFYEKLKKDFPEKTATRDLFASRVALDYLVNDKNYKKAEYYFNQVIHDFRRMNMMYPAALQYSGGVDGEPLNLDFAYNLSKLSLDSCEKIYKESVKTGSEEIEDLKDYYVTNLSIYALTSFKKKKFKQALDAQSIAFDITNGQNKKSNERYTIYNELVNGGEATIKILDRLYREGYASVKMKEQLIRLINQHPRVLNQDLESYLASAGSQAKSNELKQKSNKLNQLEVELKAVMIDEQSQPFSLKNIHGETVSSESLKGKIVILDFWATWCRPCIASFPGMQKAVDKYANRKDIVFLFINSGENIETVQGFLEENPYKFNILMDEAGELSDKYGVEGLPTKLVLNKRGRLVFNKGGSDGDDTYEIDKMIELALD